MSTRPTSAPAIVPHRVGDRSELSNSLRPRGHQALEAGPNVPHFPFSGAARGWFLDSSRVAKREMDALEPLIAQHTAELIRLPSQHGLRDPRRAPRRVSRLADARESIPTLSYSARPGGTPQSSVHLPIDALPQALCSIKVKWLQETYQTERFRNVQLSKLYDCDGICFVMTPTRKKGGSGKIRWAVQVDELRSLAQPNALAVKEMRHVPSRMRNGERYDQTAVVSPREARREAMRTEALREVMERTAAPFDQLPAYHPQSLQKARTAAVPFKLYACVHTSIKTYMVMTKDVGCLADLFRTLDEPLRAYAAASAWAQITTELKGLHEDAGFVHLDISPGNIFVTKTGQFKLMDFGKAERNEKISRHKRGIVGTLVPPEAVFTIKGRNDLMQLDGFTDVFCTAATIAGIFARPAMDNIFAHCNLLPGYTSRTRSFQNLYVQMNNWRLELADCHTNRVTAARILSADSSMFKEFFAPLARAHPALCETLINDAMELRPAARKSAAQLAEEARSLLPADFTQRDALIRAIDSLGDRQAMQNFYKCAVLYDAWDEQMTRNAAMSRAPELRVQFQPGGMLAQ